MAIDNNDLVKHILDNLSRIKHIKSEDIPDINLYMDQLTTLMNSKLSHTTRHPGQDKVLTKTMINNYAKNDLLPPPIRKKYSKEHVFLLIFIYYYKGILSINDIQTLLGPITDKYFGAEKNITLQEIYEEVFSMEEETVEFLIKDVQNKYAMAQETFSDVKGKDAEFLQQFSFICMLSYDVYVKKMIIEKMIDRMRKSEEKNVKNKKE